MEGFRDRAAIVTGGASGMGRELCRQLGRSGAAVTLADLNGDGARAVAEEITAAGGRARAVELDVGREGAMQRLVDETVDEHGRLDVLFNNAGTGIGGDYREITLAHWQRLVDVHLWGVVYGTHAAYEVMVRQGHGHIVNTASLAGLVAVPTLVSYAAVKHAIVGLSTSLRIEGAALGVKVSVVCPGLVRTGIFEASEMPGVDRDAALAQLPRWMTSADRAAEIILRGVARNRAIITVGWDARLIWWAHRLHPALVAPLQRMLIRDTRKHRVSP